MQLEVLIPQKSLADLLALLSYTMMDSSTKQTPLFFQAKKL
jgi:hypothetical protein